MLEAQLPPRAFKIFNRVITVMLLIALGVAVAWSVFGLEP